jgi:dinuclear metal center YbgI/SA1388 family protein
MTTVRDILSYLDTIAPKYMKMDWDNVGLLCGSSSQNVGTVLIALDPFEDVCQEAIDIGADLIVTHHPIIFGSLKAITDETSTGRAILNLARHGISAINAHTNLDCAPGGVNDVLAGMLSLQDVQVINPSGEDAQGRPWGLLRMGSVQLQPLEEFLKEVKTALQCEGLRYAGERPVEKVAVGGGSCGSALMDAYNAGCDTFVTADIKYNQFFDAVTLGMNIIDAGHFHTENPVVTYLAEKISEAFPEITVKISGIHRDCMKFY